MRKPPLIDNDEWYDGGQILKESGNISFVLILLSLCLYDLMFIIL